MSRARSAIDSPDTELALSKHAALATRRLVVRSRDVVFVKGIVEAHDGLGHVFATSGGDLTIAAPLDREAELAELVHDLAAELGGLTGREGDE